MSTEFPEISKEAWLQQIAKDLKDKPLESLDWQVADDLRITPLVHADDFPKPPAPLWEQALDWEIGEKIHLGADLTTANRQVMEALEGGAEGLHLHFEQALSASELGQVLQGVHLDFIGLHCSGPWAQANPAAILGGLETLAKQNAQSTAQWRGSLAFDPLQLPEPIDWRYTIELLLYANRQFPGIRLFTLQLPSDLGAALKHLNTFLHQLTERGAPLPLVLDSLQVAAPLGKQYFLEIARLRALRLLWNNLSSAWGQESPLHIQAQFQAEAYTDDLYTNLIRGTTMAMSAALGGANALVVLPYDAGRENLAQYPEAFGRRMARNVQHLLKMESHLNSLADPAAGSYYVERLTQQLAEKAWAALQTSS